MPLISCTPSSDFGWLYFLLIARNMDRQPTYRCIKQQQVD